MPLYSAYLEEQIDNLIFMLSSVEAFTEEEQRWPVSRKIKKAKQVAAKVEFEGRDDLVTVLDEAKYAFEERNKIVHGRIYGNFDRPDTLKSGRPNIPDREIASHRVSGTLRLSKSFFRPPRGGIPSNDFQNSKSSSKPW